MAGAAVINPGYVRVYITQSDFDAHITPKITQDQNNAVQLGDAILINLGNNSVSVIPNAKVEQLGV